MVPKLRVSRIRLYGDGSSSEDRNLLTHRELIIMLNIGILVLGRGNIFLFKRRRRCFLLDLFFYHFTYSTHQLTNLPLFSLYIDKYQS
ncbi:hypothetical protein BX600DRAFT_477472 [Xylariales sp. PMI_506]|nr:hypothetical protein BX600DRAFT_477472 [Xylariales sp. PMI_506]